MRDMSSRIKNIDQVPKGADRLTTVIRLYPSLSLQHLEMQGIKILQ